jgi:hypothetical protein
MHWRTYDRLRRAHDIIDARLTTGLATSVDRALSLTVPDRLLAIADEVIE